uniref:Uncharacterized protein n=1 Tax=Siphoviridae sp. ctxMM9 TaxID=2827973 RepID=A0A8S5T5Z4_9CAUD|nr:MAG TPA: hypothetical protein [Siphoviridae sp. ctxMM9]
MIFPFGERGLEQMPIFLYISGMLLMINLKSMHQ